MEEMEIRRRPQKNKLTEETLCSTVAPVSLQEALEWGWMRAMGRDVLYLTEETFDLARADWGGLIQDKFPWGNPDPAITKAIEKWLGKP